MDESKLKEYEALPKAWSHRVVDFEQAEIVTLESFPPQYVLVVRGSKPYLNMRIELVPLVYVRRPEYWGIEVVGRLRGGIGLPAAAPYTASIPIAGITGTEGIEVIGATGPEKLRVPPADNAGTCRGWSAWHDHQPPGPPVLHVRGECEFPTAGYSVELRRAEPQGIDPKNLLLNLVVRAPTGPASQVITKLEARFSEETDIEYETVTILPDGGSVPVRDVH